MSSIRTPYFHVLVPAAAILIIAVLAAVGVQFLSEKEEDARFANRETEVSVANLTDRPCVVLKAGGRLEEAAVSASFDPRGTWLTAGNYFVMTTNGADSAYYPVPLNAYRSGPDPDGRFTVTVRPFPSENPRRLLPESPPFRYIPSGSFLLGDRLNPGEQHYVWLTGYFIAPFEVSNGEFRRFVLADDGYADDRNWTGAGRQQKEGSASHVSAMLGELAPRYRRFGQQDQPVTMVS